MREQPFRADALRRLVLIQGVDVSPSGSFALYVEHASIATVTAVGFRVSISTAVDRSR